MSVLRQPRRYGPTRIVGGWLSHGCTMRIDRKVNFSDIVQRAILLEELSQGKKWHNVTISPARTKATQQQHGYYRAVVVPIAKMWLNDTQGGMDDGEDYDEDAAHWFLKITLRPIPVVNPNTGKQISVTAKSHATYTTKQMAEFIDDVIALLGRFDVTVPPPDRSYQEVAA